MDKQQTTPELLSIAQEVGARVSAEHRPADDPLVSMDLNTLAAFVVRVTAAPQEGVRKRQSAARQLSNIAYNWAQQEGKTLNARDCALLKEVAALFDSENRAPESPQPLAPPPGYAVVPIEPTEAMEVFVHRQAWKNAVDAAPPPLSPPDTGNVGVELNWREVAVWWEQGAKDWQDLKEIIPRMFKRAALPPPGRGMVPMSPEKRDEIYRQVQAEVAQMEAEHRYTFAGWFPVAVRLVEAHHGIKEGSATPLGDGGSGT